MKYVILIMIIISFFKNGFSVGFDQASNRKILLEMTYQDQLLRGELQSEQARGDSITIDALWQNIRLQDSMHFSELERIIAENDHIIPEFQLNDKDFAKAIPLFVHWSEEFPFWFNRGSVTKAIKKQIDEGNLKLWIVDMAHYMYISFTDHDLSYLDVINNARLLYGLNGYTEKQFLKQESVIPLTK